MAKLLKLRRGTTSQHSSFTGAEGEVTIDTTKDTAVVHDGSQAGGRPLAREDMSNVSSIARTKLANVDVVDDTSPQLGGNLDTNGNYIFTSTTNGNVPLQPNGTGAVEVKGAGGNDGTLQLNCSANSHGIKLKSPAHSAAATYTLTFPTTDGNNHELLKSDGSGNLSWTTVGADNIAADAITEPKIADNAVVTATILNGNVTTLKIADDAVTADKLASDAVVTASIVNDAVTEAKIANDAVRMEHILANNVTSSEIAANAVTQAKIADDAVGADQLASDAVVNASVSASAAIAGSKIAPDFGSQNVVTTGTLGSANITITSTTPELNLTESDGNPDFSVRAEGGVFRIRDVTNSSDRIQVQTDGTVDIFGNLDAQAGIDVTGAIAGSTTISDSKGNVRSIPRENKSSAHTLVAGDAGKAIYISSGGVTLPASVMSQADAVTIINDSSSNQTLTQGSGLTLYNTGDATTGNRTLAARGMATVYFASGTTAYISGSGLS